jgi:hypothetical protein
VRTRPNDHALQRTPLGRSSSSVNSTFAAKTMKAALFAPALALTLLGAGCSDPSKPLDSGAAVSGTVWKWSRQRIADNEGNPIPPGSRVDVHPSLIIIHLADGSRQIVPLDHVSDLKLK